MRRTVLTIISASALLLSTLPNNTHSEEYSNIPTLTSLENETYTYTNYQSETVIEMATPTQNLMEVASSSAKAKSGSYKFKYNTNVRLDAGTKNKVVMVAKRGATSTATHQKKVGSKTWYKVKVGSKSGWVLSTLLAPKTSAKAAIAKSSKASGTYKTKYNSNVRAKAGIKNKIVTLAKKGTTVKVSATTKVGKSTWYKISANGKTGWISGSLLTKTTSTSTKKATAQPAIASAKGTYKTKYNSNVRAKAGTKYKVVTLARKGTTVKVSASTKVGKSTWYKISANGKTGWISGSLLTKTTVKSAKAATVKKASSNYSSSAIVQTALSLVGTPYRFGGTTPLGFDCSGFSQYVFKQNGISISRTTLTQFADTTTVTNPQPGDLVFFANTYRPGISHLGIYIGNNQFVHSGGAKAEVKSLNDVYWGPKFHSFKRFN